MKTKTTLLVLVAGALSLGSVLAAPPIQEHHPIAEQKREDRAERKEAREEHNAMVLRYHYQHRRASTIALMIEEEPRNERPAFHHRRHKLGIHHR